MLAKGLKEEAGYSLIEVMVSMILLALAILPMMSMFDMGLHGVTSTGQYDKARMLANLKLEQANNLPFASVENNFPAGITTPYDGTAWFTEPGADFATFQYTVKKQYMTQPPANPGSSVDFTTSGTATDLIRVTVTVQWSDGGNTKSFTTSGLVAR